MEILGHFNSKTGEKQLLMDHLINVAFLGKVEAESINQGKVLFLLGLLHDLGKSDRNFQRKLLSKPTMHVNHSSAGAKYFEDYIIQKISDFPLNQQELMIEFCEIVMYVITAHHGIYDIPDRNKQNKKINKLFARVDYFQNSTDIQYEYESDVISFAKKLESEMLKKNVGTFDSLVKSAFEEFLSIREKIDSKKEEELSFYRGLIVRLYLSFLKNADIKDTINAYGDVIKSKQSEEKNSIKQSYLSSIESLYQSFGVPDNEINRVRTELAEKIKNRGKNDGAGIYRLNLPTGAGKTMMTLRYACQQMVNQNKRRFLYITPFLSVLEQNAKEIKKIIGVDDVLEHHSNIFTEEEFEYTLDNIDEDFEVKKANNDYLIDSWDSSAVLTTMVQFFQTLFKGKSSNIRRFSQFTNSVIILDEVQSLPVEVTTLFNLAMNFLASVMNSTIVLCTATQPKYDDKSVPFEIKYGGKNHEDIDLVTMCPKDREIFDRTVVNKMKNNDISSLEDIKKEIIANPTESILVILNTKKAAENLYKLLSDTLDRKIYYLSTNLCPLHRIDVINEMRVQMKMESIVCVSTQLIEAGVDLDFNRLIRSYAGIDSIVQAIGRCNREGRLVNKGKVSLVKLSEEEENISMLKGYKEKRDITEQIIKPLKSPIDILELNDMFFEIYYANTKLNKFNYPIEKDLPTGFELLALNSENCQNIETGYLTQSFETAARNIDLIKNDTYPIIVNYKDNQEIINQLFKAVELFDFEKVNYLKKKLQLYTINVYSLENYKQSLMSCLNGKILILSQGNYDSVLGITEELGLLQF